MKNRNSRPNHRKLSRGTPAFLVALLTIAACDAVVIGNEDSDSPASTGDGDSEDNPGVGGGLSVGNDDTDGEESACVTVEPGDEDEDADGAGGGDQSNHYASPVLNCLGVQGVRETDSNTPANNQLDLLFVVDNSVSMLAKTVLLDQTLPRFMDRLLTPPEGKEGTVGIDDIHIGVITSSLGGHGSSQCERDEVDEQGIAYNKDDRGRLIPSVRDGVSDPDGDGILRFNGGSAEDKVALIAKVREQILAAGERGCGFEAPLESWYRFLVDPRPPQEIVMDSLQAQMTTDARGKPLVDETLLAQRAAFLRPESSVAIVLVTDEDDCSVMDGGEYYGNSKYGWLTPDVTRPAAANTPICDTNPNDKCCFSCLQSQSPPSGCGDAAAACERTPELAPVDDRANVRCFDGKKRFGVDLLYPVSRYVEALTKDVIVDARSGEKVSNPLLAGVGASAGTFRNPRHVFFTGIVGVPWQDLATADTLDDAERLKYLSGSTLDDADDLLDGSNRWDLILGEPNLPDTSPLCSKFDDGEMVPIENPDPRCGKAPVPPLDPFMVASIAPRTTGATNPITGDEIVAFTSENPFANAINGHEANHEVSDPRFQGEPANDDLQYSCIFQMPTPQVNCLADDANCDCGDEPLRNRSLCQSPDGGPAGTTQYFEKAYPAPRVLEVLRDFGNNSVVASICPKITTGEESNPYFGYNPAMDALAKRIWSVR